MSILKNTPPKYVKGVSTNNGIIPMSSNLVALIPTTSPNKENNAEVSITLVINIKMLNTLKDVKNIEIKVTKNPTSNPL